MVVAGIVVAEVRELSVRIQDPYFVAKAPAEPEHGIAGRCRGRHYQDAWFRASATRGNDEGERRNRSGRGPFPCGGRGERSGWNHLRPRTEGAFDDTGLGRPTTPTTNSACLHRYWMAANYLTVAQIYLRDNVLLRRPLVPPDIKPRLLGHWGTSPGLSLAYVHLNG